jgi:glycerol-3-phosphate dehydrogenase
MVDEANSAFPTLHLRRRDILLVHSGLTPAVVRRGRAELMPESEVIAHPSATGCEVYSLVGVKFTTARLTALDALARLGLRGRPGPDETRRDGLPVGFPHGCADGADAALRAACLQANVELDEDVTARLVDWYGTEAADVLAFSAAAGHIQRLAPECPAVDGELLYAVERCQAMTLADAVLRRTGIGAAGHPGRAALDRAADVLALRLGWTGATRAGQVRAVETRYEPGVPTDDE